MSDETEEELALAPEKPDGACRFGDCTAAAATTAELDVDVELLCADGHGGTYLEVVMTGKPQEVALCTAHAGMVRGRRFPESLRGFTFAADDETWDKNHTRREIRALTLHIVGLPTPEPATAEEPTNEQVQVPAFFPFRPQTAPNPAVVGHEFFPGTVLPCVTVVTPLHPGEIWAFNHESVGLFIKELQKHRRLMLLEPPPNVAPHPMAQSPIVGPNGG